MSLKEIKFSKMHGLGNDYIVIDETNGEIIPENKKSEITAEICRRGFSIGADGVIFVTPSKSEDIWFRIFNSDGSEAEMCGNGIRCFSKFVYDKGIITKENIDIETLGGTKKVELTVENGKVTSSKVNMGSATFKTSQIPMTTDKEEFLDKELTVNGNPLKMSAVSVGNPHAIIFTDNLEEVPLNEMGPVIETHKAFPQKINVHYVKILSKNEIDMITWERGAGVTFACGTGATSCVLAGFKLGKLDNDVLVHLPGGDLNISVYEKDKTLGAFMEGDAVLVFDGIIELNL